MQKKINIRIVLDIILIIVIVVDIIVQKSNKNTKKVSEQMTNIENESKAASEITSDWDTTKVDIVEDEEGVKVPVPKGFSASKITGEQTVRTGFVIYETGNEVNNGNKDQMQSRVNQFVWVPIDNINEMYGRDKNGVAHGKLYNFKENGREIYNWSEDENGIISINNTSLYYEPIKQEVSTTILTDKLKEEVKLYNQDFENMIRSIRKYGGFYIGRYETGSLSTDTPQVVKGNTDITNQNWNTMKTKCENISNNHNVKTMMIFGCQWDAMLEWLVETETKSYYVVGKNSNSWGNFTGSIKATGSSETYKANNIYDLTGNLWDWTQEAYGSGKVAVRGGCYANDNTYRYASCRYGHGFNDSVDNFIGCRATLYIALDTL